MLFLRPIVFSFLLSLITLYLSVITLSILFVIFDYFFVDKHNIDCYSCYKEVNKSMTQGDRIKAIRKHFKLTMEKFGNKLGVTKVAISNIEKGNRNLTEQMSKAICREFNVNEDWLKTGNGEMFAPTDKFNLNDYMKSRGATDLEMELMRAYFDLDEDVRKEIMEHFVTKFSKAAQKNPAAFVPDTPEELEKIAPPVQVKKNEVS